MININCEYILDIMIIIWHRAQTNIKDPKNERRKKNVSESSIWEMSKNFNFRSPSPRLSVKELALCICFGDAHKAP